MKNTNPIIDNYINKAEPFAQPILKHIRELVHEVCPDVKELMKWSFPHFDYKDTMFCSMAAFKQHAVFGFWKASIMADPDGILTIKGRESMGHLGKLTNVNDLPSDEILKKYLKEAMRLNDEGIKLPEKAKPTEKKELVVPEELAAALNENAVAKSTFEGFSNSNKKEYIDWLIEAKSEETKARRLETTIEWLSEGKIRNWKYLRK